MELDTGLDANVADATSQSYIGQWQGLVSTTNWEKGRIIHEWRDALIAAGAAVQQFSDEAWSRRVPQVSGQHTGRLRRVYERFYAVRETYPGLYWSHFQAALDWADAEMWLEGAVQNNWSIAEMRSQRWEAFGGDASEAPAEEEVSADLDEDYAPIEPSDMREVRDPVSGVDFGDEDFGDGDSATSNDTDEAVAGVPFDVEDNTPASTEPERGTFEHLAELPPDLSEAFESFKLSILRHKLSGWADVSRSDVLASLDALKELAVAPAS